MIISSQLLPAKYPFDNIENLYQKLKIGKLFPLKHFHPMSEEKALKVHFGSLCFQDRIVLYFKIFEQHPLCNYFKDGDPVWQDSAIEFFIKNPTNTNEYFNFEFNFNGSCLAQSGQSRDSRTEFDQKKYSQINRYAIKSNNFWELTIEVPFRLIGLKEGLRDQKFLEFNINKCCSSPSHWLTLFPIKSDKPDFHRPEYFQKLLILSK